MTSPTTELQEDRDAIVAAGLKMSGTVHKAATEIASILPAEGWYEVRFFVRKGEDGAIAVDDFIARPTGKQESRWIAMNKMGSAYEEEMDVNSRETSIRHRLRAFTGEPVNEWKPGPAPVDR